MGHDRGSVLILVDDSTDNSSTHLEPKLHIVNRTSPLTKAMPNLRSFSSYQNKYTGETPLTFCTFTLYARGLDWFNKIDRVAHHIRKVLIRDRLPKNGFLMEELIIQTTEKNTVNNPEDLVRIWNQWDSDTRGIFTERNWDVANLIAINVDERLTQAMVRFWDLAYHVFTFNQEDMTLTIEEYAGLLRIDNVQFYKIYVKEPKLMTFKKKFGSEPPRHVEEGKSVRFGHLWSDRFPKVLGHLEVTVVDFFERLKTRNQPCPNYSGRNLQIIKHL
ncbi:hypothetical protein CXB51_025124 [Gossypium anomalum]|uniref:DUF7745 domain-containing protein n=1 Tax=Gossypium anomalum TaxID=47600 RepID=A0A8J5YE08_9ROSI|nr:hypothetical protein CXB51_025124 [Gossypium anomalum]